MPIQISSSFQGKDSTRVFDRERVAVGRPSDTDAPDLDLSADSHVSRHHALIFLADRTCWIRDLGSKFGTQVNGCEIKNHTKWRLFPEDTIRIGETILRVLLVSEAKAPGLGLPAEPAAAAPSLRIVQMMDTDRELTLGTAGPGATAEQRLALLLDLPRQFAAQTAQNKLLQTVMTRVVEVIPAAKRGALLLRDPHQEALLLKAYVSADEPAVSQTLARRTLDEKRAFIWRADQTTDTTRSMRQFQILSGMYAPLQWQDRIFGVICVDSPVATDTFKPEDLQFLIAIGLYAGMALAEQQSRAELQRNKQLLERMLANFSPKVRAVLVEQSRLGKLRPGGTKSEVTILFCDICGFTQQAAQMDAHDVVNMLNEYLQPLTQAILRHEGTVDKFVGDGILAVFGSPEPDTAQHQKAVQAALALQQAVLATSAARKARGDVTCQVRIGLHSGEVFHGFIGGLDRLEFTVIGDAVNRACRYCEAAGEGEILISPDVFQRVFQLIKFEKSSIHTKEGELTAFRVKGLHN